jgi:cobalt-zinc-cadmium efflux system membrane fusion protein
MARLATTVTTAFLFAAALAAPMAHAHEGHDEAKPAAAAPAAPRVVAEGSDWELVAAAKGHVLTIYLDRRTTNAPVEGATIEVLGDGIEAATAKTVGPGTYEIEAGWVDEPGTKALTFTVAADGNIDLLAGTLVIPAGMASEEGAAEGWLALVVRPVVWLPALALLLAGFFLGFAFRPARLPADAAPAPEAEKEKSQATKIVRTAAQIVVATLAIGAAFPASDGVAHEGNDHGEESAPAAAPGSAPGKLPTGEVFMPKATQRLLHVLTAPAAMSKAQQSTELVATVIADPAHEGRVQAPMDGQVELAGGDVSYVGKQVTAGDVLALIAPAMPVYERGTLAQVTADVEGKLRIAEQKLARLERISGDYIPQREIDDTKTEIESLRQQREVLQPKNTERLELKAPVSGIISVATVRAGQVVSARDTLFEIVDPQRLWIEAIGIAGTDDGADVRGATAVDAEGHKIPLTFIGRAPTLRNQALPLLFRVEEAHASLRIGGSVKVLVQYGDPVDGIVVPNSAVVRAPNGLPQVWIKVAPERFAPKLVTTVPLDGERILVKSGIASGDRVVVEAAELINQVR